MTEQTFLDLVKQNNGFEVCLGFRNDVDHYVGGTGNKVWYCIQKGSNAEYWVGTLDGGAWTDKHYKAKGKKITLEEPAESGSAIAMAVDQAYFGQDYIQSDGRAPSHVENFSMKVSHYTYKFGEIAYDISEDYGVTVSYSNINDEEAGFRTRGITVGASVTPPKE